MDLDKFYWKFQQKLVDGANEPTKVDGSSQNLNLESVHLYSEKGFMMFYLWTDSYFVNKYCESF